MHIFFEKSVLFYKKHNYKTVQISKIKICNHVESFFWMGEYSKNQRYYTGKNIVDFCCNLPNNKKRKKIGHVISGRSI